MKVLVIATLFPNPGAETFGVFVRSRLQALAKHVQLTVVSPVPWFPGATMHPRYYSRREIPQVWASNGLTIHYPRFLSVPRYLKGLDALSLMSSLERWVRINGLANSFDLIDAQLAHPDGFAAMRLAEQMKVPFVTTLRGHDVNVLPDCPRRGPQVREVLRAASRVFPVADALGAEAVRLGCMPERVRTVVNGVDNQVFKPMPRSDARAMLGQPQAGRLVLSVGHLVERKGHHVVIEALQLLHALGHSDVRLAIVGGASVEGDVATALAARVAEAGLGPFVTMAGVRPNSELSLWYNAADVLCLASSEEGRPNVVVEALACGTPVVATRVWGTPEIVTGPTLGTLVDRSAPAFATAMLGALDREWNRDALVAHVKPLTWEAVGAVLAEEYRALVNPLQVQ